MSANPAEPTVRASRFSLGRIWTIGTHTFTQLVRMRVFYFLLIFVLLVAAVAFFFFSSSPEQELKILRDVGLGAMLWFSIIFAIVGTAILIPKDIEDRTLYTILSKPVPRIEYLLGKFLGVLILIGVSLVVMDLVLSGLLFLREKISLSQIQGALAAVEPDSVRAAELEAEYERVSAMGLSWSLHAAPVVIFLKAAILTAMALMLSTFASSTLFTVIVGFVVYFIGHTQGLARDYFLSGGETGIAERFLTIGLALFFPDLGLFNVGDTLAAGATIGAGLLLKLAGLSLLYVIVYNVLAHLFFADKEF